MPDFSYEQQINGLVAGVDEAGRGPWAGPVTAAAVIFHTENIPAGLDDSKKLSRKKRKILFEALQTLEKEGACSIAVSSMSVEIIDRYNILEATKMAMIEALQQLTYTPTAALIDGNQPLPALPYPTHCITKGDSISLSIAAASIIAKETRDRLMETLAQHFPLYGWESNAGYGTKFHQEALKQHGITPHHRKSFAPIRALCHAA